MRRLTLSAACVLAILIPLAGCGWVADSLTGRHGTGEPEWRFPETYVDHPDRSRYVTLDESGAARVSDIPDRGAGCHVPSEMNITGEGVWEATGYGMIRIKIDDRVILVESGVYRGELDWGRLIVTSCVDELDEKEFLELYHTGYLMGS